MVLCILMHLSFSFCTISLYKVTNMALFTKYWSPFSTFHLDYYICVIVVTTIYTSRQITLHILAKHTNIPPKSLFLLPQWLFCWGKEFFRKTLQPSSERVTALFPIPRVRPDIQVDPPCLQQWSNILPSLRAHSLPLWEMKSILSTIIGHSFTSPAVSQVWKWSRWRVDLLKHVLVNQFLQWSVSQS